MRFKIIKQKDSMQCGIACLSSICLYYGEKYSLDFLEKLCHSTSEGISLKAIADGANKLGLNTRTGLISADYFSTDNNDKSIIIIYPAQQEYAEDDGREAVEWDKQWFSGNFVVGFGSNVTSQPIHYKSLSLSPAKDATIIRGTVYASVLYNNEWRECVITTM